MQTGLSLLGIRIALRSAQNTVERGLWSLWDDADARKDAHECEVSVARVWNFVYKAGGQTKVCAEGADGHVI